MLGLKDLRCFICVYDLKGFARAAGRLTLRLSTLALVLLLAAAISLPALARGGNAGGNSGGRSGSHAGARGAQHSHARPGGSAPNRYFPGRPRIGFFLGAPVFAAPYFYPAPAQLAPMPPIEYIEKPPEAGLYFCPEANGYYPLVWQCPSGWEQALAPATAPPFAPYSAGAPDPANPHY